MDPTKINAPVEYWDKLQTKESLYQEFENMASADRNVLAVGSRDPEMDFCYKDSEFKAIADKLEKAAKDLRPVLKDIVEHFSVSDNYKDQVKKAMYEIRIDDNGTIADSPNGIAALALLLFNALDSDAEKSFINRIKKGGGIPKERAARRAYKRYRTFKSEDAARLEEFKKTPEYALQEAEMKFKQREKIDFPEE